MCDCYNHKCKYCEALLCVHLGDWETKHDEIEVFCEKHTPWSDPDVYVFLCCLNDKAEPDMFKYRDPFIMSILPLTGNAKRHMYFNHPNSARYKRIVEPSKRYDLKMLGVVKELPDEVVE